MSVFGVFLFIPGISVPWTWMRKLALVQKTNTKAMVGVGEQPGGGRGAGPTGGDDWLCQPFPAAAAAALWEGCQRYRRICSLRSLGQASSCEEQLPDEGGLVWTNTRPDARHSKLWVTQASPLLPTGCPGAWFDRGADAQSFHYWSLNPPFWEPLRGMGWIPSSPT